MRRLQWVRRFGLALVIVGLAWVFLARTGSDHGEVDAGHPEATREFLASVWDRTVVAPRFGYVCEVVVREPGEPELWVRDEGAVDRGERRLWRRFSLTHGQETLPALRLLADGDRLFLQPGLVAPAVGLAPDDWIAAPGATDAGTAAPGAMGELLWSDGSFPEPAAVLLGLLLEVGDEVELVGRDQVRGVATTHLRAVAHHRDWPDGSNGVPLDVWVDADDRLRRVDVVPTAAVSLRLELFDYDESVDPDIPDDSAVVANSTDLIRAALTHLRD